jgi:membrane protease YdiL (CAAX protease family)
VSRGIEHAESRSLPTALFDDLPCLKENIVTSSTYTPDVSQRPPVKGWHIAAAFAALVVVYGIGFAIGGEVGQIMLAGLQTLPFVLLALLAYLGIEQLWAKVAALLWLAAVVLFSVLFSLGLSVTAVLEPNARPGSLALADGGGSKLALIFVLSSLGIVVGALGFIPGVRRALSRVIPLDPDSFVHTLALVTVVALMLIAFTPLIVLGAPPLLLAVQRLNETGADLTAGRGDGGMLRDTVYGLVWMIPGAIVAVGYAVRRDLRAALARVGLVRPTWRQVLAGLALAVALVLAVQILSAGIDWLWSAMGWPKTDEKAFGNLLSFAMSPLGAVVVGVTAGLGEELAVRGVLQPRMGILLSNLFFTSLHALQYNWDALLVVFVVGLALGLIRRRTNTTTSAITHGTYDFLLILAGVLHVPWFSQ